MLRKNLSIALVACGMLSAMPGLALACAVCLTGAADGTVDGYNASVLFLMATPYLVMGSIVGALVIAYRRALKRSAQAETSEEGIQLVWSQEDSGR